MRRLYPDTSEAVYGPLYAWTTFGVPVLARDMLSNVQALKGKNQPPWLETVESYLAGDTGRLVKLTQKNASYSGLAGHLATLRLWHLNSSLALAEAAFTALGQNPLNQSVAEMAADDLGVSSSHRIIPHLDAIVPVMICTELGKIKGVSVDLLRSVGVVDVEKTREVPNIAIDTLWAELAKLDERYSGHYPSLASLGYLLEGESFKAALRRMRFYQKGYSVDTNGDSDHYIQNLRSYPLVNYLRGFDDNDDMDKVLAGLSIDPNNVTVPMFVFMNNYHSKSAKLANMNWRRFLLQGVNVADYCVADLKLLDAWQREGNRKWRRCPDLLLKIDPQDEQAVYSLLYDKFLTADQALEKYPAVVEKSDKVQQRVGVDFLNQGKYKKSIAILEKCIAAHPSATAYELLAIAYWDSGDGEKFRQCMEAVQQLPDTGLTHSNYYRKMARHYGRTGKWAEARRSAEKSADSYAEWALNCAAFYCAMDGDLDKATRYSAQRMGRYGKPKGSFSLAILSPYQALDKAFVDAIEKGMVNKKYGETQAKQVELFCLYWWEGKHEKAVEIYKKYYDRERGYINWNLIYAVTIGRLGKNRNA